MLVSKAIAGHGPAQPAVVSGEGEGVCVCVPEEVLDDFQSQNVGRGQELGKADGATSRREFEAGIVSLSHVEIVCVQNEGSGKEKERGGKW